MEDLNEVTFMNTHVYNVYFRNDQLNNTSVIHIFYSSGLILDCCLFNENEYPFYTSDYR